MNNTGERHIISGSIFDKAELYNHLMHIATYKYAEKFAANKLVLDFGCGSGYGSFELSKVAEHVIATDISYEAVEYAKENFRNSNLKYCHISEISEQKFDLITSFQVIEHVSNERDYVHLLKELLADDGILLISTPNKEVRLFKSIQKPWNLFHLKEFSASELKKLFSGFFSDIEIHKIGSEKDFVMNEIERCKKQRFITLPCTLFFYPMFLRNWLLRTQSNAYNLLAKFRKNRKNIDESQQENVNIISNYTYNDIKFDNNLIYSTDILVKCRNINK
jgi:2-polyprenyl-3-methyl-5-hydroxy-6-metoxy-1,4-benzoquinol methylase